MRDVLNMQRLANRAIADVFVVTICDIADVIERLLDAATDTDEHMRSASVIVVQNYEIVFLKEKCRLHRDYSSKYAKYQCYQIPIARVRIYKRSDDGES